MNNKPLPIRLREAKESIVQNLNTVLREQELPCYLIEPIIEEVHRMVSKSAQAEYEQAVKQINEEGNEDE
jgi:hypothetical protein